MSRYPGIPRNVTDDPQAAHEFLRQHSGPIQSAFLMYKRRLDELILKLQMEMEEGDKRRGLLLDTFLDGRAALTEAMEHFDRIAPKKEMNLEEMEAMINHHDAIFPEHTVEWTEDSLPPAQDDA